MIGGSECEGILGPLAGIKALLLLGKGKEVGAGEREGKEDQGPRPSFFVFSRKAPNFSRGRQD